MRQRYRCCERKTMRDIFYRGKGRMTEPRKAILDLFHSNKGHFTAEDVFERISDEYPSIGLATIYRTLNTLYQNNILNKFEFGDGKAKFELSEHHDGQRHHHHLVCKNCGSIIEYDDFMNEEKEFFSRLEDILSKKHSFKITGHNLYFYGVCKNCESKYER
ncbi:MAG TPA: transcriptional repressor [Elusimicrobiales bacterium]|nr:transcriptional repressor [Elusimicrobiales bacterium]